MKPIRNNWERAVVSIAFGVAAFLFWRLAYPFALVWQEQYQLFLFDSGYVAERIAVPGGVAAVMAEFLTQFYNHPTIGAVIQSLLLVAIQVVTWQLMKQKGQQGMYYISSFIPSLILWYVLGDESVLPAYTLSLLIVLIVMRLHTHSPWYVLPLIPLTYWIAGPLMLLYALYATLRSIRKRSFGIGIGILLYAIFWVAISSLWLPYPTRRLFAGVFYYRFVDMFPYWLWVSPVLCLLVTHFRIHPLVTIAPLVILPFGFDAKKYELMEYDYLVRRQQWDALIAKAEKQQPDLPMSVCATNLALGMKNQLGHRAFRFYQHGTEGLTPPSERDFTANLVTGEVYWQLGLVNTAQRLTFEAMEAIPNYNKSGRAIKRLAETNLVNGQYEVAKKYLRMLEKTVFYRRWAQDKLRLMEDEQRIDSHPVYGRLRKIRLTEDFLFSETELDKMFGKLFLHDPSNSLAMQYLLMYPLLNCDMDTFMRYLTVVQDKVNYNPPVCQEGIAFAYMQRQQNPPQGYVGNPILQQFRQFVQIWSHAGKDSPQMEAFKGTLWYYLIRN